MDNKEILEAIISTAKGVIQRAYSLLDYRNPVHRKEVTDFEFAASDIATLAEELKMEEED